MGTNKYAIIRVYMVDEETLKIRFIDESNKFFETEAQAYAHLLNKQDGKHYIVLPVNLFNKNNLEGE